jgi:hypothetical protein
MFHRYLQQSLLSLIAVITLMFSQQQLQQEGARYNSIKRNYVRNIIPKLKAAEALEEKTSDSDSISHDNVFFLICQSCLWCASSLNNRSMTINDDNNSDNNKCPLCENGNLESLPIASNEGYKFDYVAKSGVLLEFFER